MRPSRLAAMPRATPARWRAARTRATVSGSDRRPSTSSNGRSARDSRLDSIGAPTVAPWVVIEPWSKPPSTSPVSCSAQTTTGTPGSASSAAIVQAAGTAIVWTTRTTSTPGLGETSPDRRARPHPRRARGRRPARPGRRRRAPSRRIGPAPAGRPGTSVRPCAPRASSTGRRPRRVDVARLRGRSSVGWDGAERSLNPGGRPRRR